MIHDDLGKRMKSFYEEIPKTKLMRRTPVAIRIDGKAFHTFTKGFNKPFDDVLVESIDYTTLKLCENVQGCVLGYVQSDEITLILVDYKKLDSQAWFDYEVQKMCSVAASMATNYFNMYFEMRVRQAIFSVYKNAIDKGAMFDARCFNIPKEEVTNFIYWRQVDAIRNATEMVGRAYYSHKQLMNKNCSQIEEMLQKDYGISMLPYEKNGLRRGRCCIKKDSGWEIDCDIPLFKGEGRKYIEKLINFEY